MKGIDVPIEVLRLEFVNNLWTAFDFTANGRAFRNERDGGIIPEILSSGNDYEEVMLQDMRDGICFFDVEPAREEANGAQKVNVNIYFAINLEALYSSISERATEYAHEDVRKIIRYSQFEITSLVTGNEAFSAFTYEHTDNLQPYYLFCFKTKINYNLNC